MKCRTRIIENKSHHAAFKVKWECRCGAKGEEGTKEQAVSAAQTHRFTKENKNA